MEKHVIEKKLDYFQLDSVSSYFFAEISKISAIFLNIKILYMALVLQS